jgi:hypothetical protein
MKTRDKGVKDTQGKDKQTKSSVALRKGIAHFSIFRHSLLFLVTFTSWNSAFTKEQRQSNTNIEKAKRDTERKQRKQQKNEETPSKKENGC